jgi:kumamolisin
MSDPTTIPAPPPVCRPYVKKPRASAAVPWKVAALCASYAFPTSAPGGKPIAIVELGGGWVASDLAAFASANGLPAFNVTDVSVDGTKNTPTPGDDSPDVEVALDIEVAAVAYHVATGGKMPAIRVYWAQDIASAVRKAADDGCGVCSISWGAAEVDWNASDVQDMEAAAAYATSKGMAVFAASGDNDADDSTGQTAVDCPASCPHVVGCGGTRKTTGSETVWNNDDDPTDPTGNGTGGGFSAAFGVQPWQVGAPAAPSGFGRMVPDVAGNADPDTGYEIVCHGASMSVGGTSAVAPLYAGLFAAFGGALGFVTPTLWANRAAFNDIVSGGNGLYSAGVGPDPCTGLGSPIGTRLAALLVASAPAPAPAPPGASPTPAPAPSGQPTYAALMAAVVAAVDAADNLETRGQIIATVGKAAASVFGVQA